MIETLTMDLVGLALVATVPLTVAGCAARALLRRFPYRR